MALELDEKIKDAVREWRRKGWEGVTPVTKRLLEFWFKDGHLLKETTFVFWRCQREAIESLIYIYEVCRYRNIYEMARGFSASVMVDPSTDILPKYAFKMATGSGKTFVMALAIVWQYFNKLYAENSDIRYTSNFLLLAPNLIVLDRLTEAFENCTIFRGYPFIPPEWKADFDLQVVLQSAASSRTAQGILHLTNIQQLYEREHPEPVNPVDALVGEKPRLEEEAEVAALRDRLAAFDDLMILNDEAHHVHSPELKWNELIGFLHDEAHSRGNGLLSQLDFSATPKDPQGAFFPHIIYNYPLKSAIEERIVKRPRIGIIEDAPLPLRGDFVSRNQVQIDAGIEMHRSSVEDFEITGGKPVLFIMCDITRNADRVGEYLEEHGYSGKVLVIHTKRSGEVTQKDLERARIAARELDSPGSPYEAIVSVMMLKEGWDVKSVNVIVPLRAFVSEILPEQTLGRGLRRLLPDEPLIDEHLIVIDHPRFRQLWEAEIEKGELVADIVPIRQVYEPPTLVQVDPEKLEYDIEFPVLEGGIITVAPDLSKLDLTKLPHKLFRLSEVKVPKIRYKEKDLLTGKLVREKTLAFDYTENLSLYISYIAKAVFAKVRCLAAFPELVVKLKDYIANNLFDNPVDPNEREVRHKLNDPKVRAGLLDVFACEVNELAKASEPTSLLRYFRVSSILPFHTTQETIEVQKCVLDQLPYPRASRLELDFIKWLDEKDEVLAFTKVLTTFPLYIPYHNHEGYLSYYLPDFIVKTDKVIYLIETKGIQDLNVPLKDAAAIEWCKRATELTETEWRYIKVKYDDFQTLRGQSFKSLAEYCTALT